MDGWTDAQIGLTDGHTDGQMSRWTDGKTGGQIDIQIERQTDGHMFGWRDGLME
jgi:hypothetical protein